MKNVYYNGKVVICPDCNSTTTKIGSYCDCGAMRYLEKSTINYSYTVGEYVFLFSNNEGNSRIFGPNNMDIILKNYCVINKTKDEILKQLLLM